MQLLRHSELVRCVHRFFLGKPLQQETKVLNVRHDSLFSYIGTGRTAEGKWARIGYNVYGNEGEIVVLIAGMCVCSSMWHKQIEALQKTYRVLTVDNRGSGASWSEEGYDVCTMARDVVSVVDWEFGRESKLHVVGHSMGSMIAQRIAVIKGERICSLSLLCGHDGNWIWSGIPSFGLIWASFGLLLGDEIRKVETFMGLHYTKRFLEERVCENGKKVRRRGEYLKRYLQGRKKEGGDIFWKHLQAVFGHGLSDDEVNIIRKQEFPVLVVYGREDVVIVPKASKELGKRLGGQVVDVGGGHFIVDENAEEVNKLLKGQFERGTKGRKGEVNGLDLWMLRLREVVDMAWGEGRWDEW